MRGDDQRTRGLRLARLDGGAADRADLLAALLAERVQRPEATLVARAPGADALARPFGLALDQPVELVPLGRLALEDIGRPGVELGIALVEAAHDAAVEPQHGARQVGEEAAIVAHQHISAAPARELGLQPLDGRQVEMVGGLVEQHDVGLGHQRTGERRAPCLAAGEVRRLAGGIELHLVEQRRDAIIVRTQRVGKRGGHIGADAGVAREIGFLRQGGDGGAGLGEARAAVGDGLARQDAQQGRFAGTVAADQRQALTRRNRQLDAVQDGLVAEVKADVAERKKGRFGHRS